jgi:anti-sigma regulatory factor (Ser/Thr protein kinase)
MKLNVTIEHTGHEMVIELRDRGPEFDPVQARKAKTEDEEETPGGWGLPLVRAYTDDIRYRREAGENILRLTRRLRDSDRASSIS